MKKTIFILLGCSVLFLSTAFTSFLSKDTKVSGVVEPDVYKVMEVAYLWELLLENYQNNYETDQTWLDVGFRSKYAMAKNYASLSALESVFGKKVFVSGPHGKDMNFNATTSFGHYNPAFVKSVHKAVEAALETPVFKTVAQQVYRNHLQGMARTYYDAHEYTYKNPRIMNRLKADYLAAMKQKGGTTEGSFQETFRAYAEEAERNGADVYEAFTAPAFWLRRDIDGTSKAFIDLLELVINELE